MTLYVPYLAQLEWINLQHALSFYDKFVAKLYKIKQSQGVVLDRFSLF